MRKVEKIAGRGEQERNEKGAMEFCQNERHLKMPSGKEM